MAATMPSSPRLETSKASILSGCDSSPRVFCSHSRVLSVFCAAVAALSPSSRALVAALSTSRSLSPRLGVSKLTLRPASSENSRERSSASSASTGSSMNLGQAPALGVVLPHQAGDGLGVVLQRLVHQLEVLPRQVPAHEMQHGEAAARAPVKAHGVRVGIYGGYHALPVAQALDGPYPVAQHCRGLEPHLLRRTLHLRRQFGRQLLCPPGEDEFRLAYRPAVLLRAQRAQAPAGAGAHVVV